MKKYGGIGQERPSAAETIRDLPDIAFFEGLKNIYFSCAFAHKIHIFHVLCTSSLTCFFEEGDGVARE